MTRVNGIGAGTLTIQRPTGNRGGHTLKGNTKLHVTAARVAVGRDIRRYTLECAYRNRNTCSAKPLIPEALIDVLGLQYGHSYVDYIYLHVLFIGHVKLTGYIEYTVQRNELPVGDGELCPGRWGSYCLY